MHRSNCFLRNLVWGTLIALFVSGPHPCVAQDLGRSGVLVVPIGGTATLQMKSKKPIKTVENPKENVISIKAVIGDPTTIRITGQTPDVTKVILTDVDERKEEVEVVVQLDVEYLKTQLRRAVPMANIQVIPSSNNAVILTGTVARPEDINVILQVAQSIGGIQVINGLHVGGVQQVQLDVVVAAVSRTFNRNIGFDWEVNSHNSFFGSYVAQAATIPSSIGSSVGSAGGAASGASGATGGLTTFPLGGLIGTPAGADTFLFGTLHSGWGLLGFLNALKTEGVAKFITQPSLVTLSGRPATFLVGGDQAVPVVGGIGGATGIQFEPFGTQLTFLPIVLGDGKIHLEVSPSITDLDAAYGAIVQGNLVPGRSRESVNTTVRLESGQTFVIGGFTRHVVNSSSRRLPFFGEIPFFGNLFSSRSDEDTEEEIVILVTPHLVDPQDCNQLAKVLPGQEARSPDDFELYLEGILEAPRGPRKVFQNRHYVPAYLNGPSAEVYPCAGTDRVHGGVGVKGASCGPKGCPTGGVGSRTPPAPAPGMPPAAPRPNPALPGPNQDPAPGLAPAAPVAPSPLPSPSPMALEPLAPPSRLMPPTPGESEIPPPPPQLVPK